MNINKQKFEQIKLCLNCSIGIDVISNYLDIYELHNQQPHNFKEEDVQLISEIAEKLQLTGNVEEKFSLLEKLHERNSFNSNNTNICLANLQKVISSLYVTYSEQLEEGGDINHSLVSVLKIMHEQNKEHAKRYDGLYGDEFLKELSQIKKYIAFDSESKERLLDEMMKIRDTFSKFPRKSYLINNPSECFRYSLSKIKEEYLKETDKQTESNVFFNRVNMLSKISQNIIKEYIRTAPKQFGFNLKSVMKKQGMTEQDISQITNIPVSAIQSLEKAEMPQRESSEISLLCKALLISENVLFTGTGKIYGNWKHLFDNDSLSEIGKELNIIRKKDIKENVREIIKKIIKTDENEFEQIIKSESDLFQTTDFCTYSSLEEAWYILLHQREVYTLLDVLEKIDKQ